MRCQHHKHMAYPHWQNSTASSVSSSSFMHRGQHASSSPSDIGPTRSSTEEKGRSGKRHFFRPQASEHGLALTNPIQGLSHATKKSARPRCRPAPPHDLTMVMTAAIPCSAVAVRSVSSLRTAPTRLAALRPQTARYSAVCAVLVRILLRPASADCSHVGGAPHALTRVCAVLPAAPCGCVRVWQWYSGAMPAEAPCRPNLL